MISAWPAGNVGDGNQSTGIAGAIRRALVRANIAEPGNISSETLEITGSPDATKTEQLTAACETWLARLRDGEYEKVFFILSGSGDELASALGNMPTEKGFTTVFSGHQLSDDIKNADKLPSITALPKSSVTAEQQAALEPKTKLVLVSGVAHQLSDEKIAQTVTEYHAKGYRLLPEIDANTVAVILGGDAPDEAGHFQFFSENDARGLAKRIAQVELSERKGCRFIVTNGPRTGKFDLTGAECSPNPHRTEEVDQVTRAFVDELARFEGSDVHLFDFQFSQLPSAYLPLIDAFVQAGSNRGHIHVPGESISMVSEVTSVLSGVVIDEIPSMNASHRKHVEQVLGHSGADMLRIDGSLDIRASELRQANHDISAADVIAEAAVSHILQENT